MLLGTAFPPARQHSPSWRLGYQPSPAPCPGSGGPLLVPARPPALQRGWGTAWPLPPPQPSWGTVGMSPLVSQGEPAETRGAWWGKPYCTPGQSGFFWGIHQEGRRLLPPAERSHGIGRCGCAAGTCLRGKDLPRGARAPAQRGVVGVVKHSTAGSFGQAHAFCPRFPCALHPHQPALGLLPLAALCHRSAARHHLSAEGFPVP